MNVVTPFVADSQSSKATEPRERALDNPTMSAQALAGLDATPGDSTLDTALSQSLAAPAEIVSLVSVQFVGALSRTTTGTPYWLDGIEHLVEHPGVVEVRGRELRREWDALAVDHNMALRARFPAIRRIRAGFAAPPGAAMLAESSEARDQSILSASPNRLSKL